MDNDRLSLTEADDGYTAGFSLAYSGLNAKKAPLSLHRPLKGLTKWLGLNSANSNDESFQFHSTSYGLAAFTPTQIDIETPIPDDRPYACLTYTASTRQTVVPKQNTAFLNTFSVGLIGTNFCRELQNFVHDAANGIAAQGWDNQISDGGELTALWRTSRQRLIHTESAATRHEVSWSYDAQLGWATDVGIGVSWRWGAIRSPWWSFTPQHTEYTPFSAPISHYRGNSTKSSDDEFYIWAGGMVRYRVYNSLLQGQFRDSVVEVSDSDLESALAEIWIGYTQRIDNGWEINLSIRARSREFDSPNSKSVLWGSLALRKHL